MTIKRAQVLRGFSEHGGFAVTYDTVLQLNAEKPVCCPIDALRRYFLVMRRGAETLCLTTDTVRSFESEVSDNPDYWVAERLYDLDQGVEMSWWTVTDFRWPEATV